jgi:uncharacterized membrane protein
VSRIQLPSAAEAYPPSLASAPDLAVALPVPSVPAEAGASRLAVVDVARVFAILFMIQGHALDVLLAPQYRQGWLFDTWLFLRGLTAPMFLILSGVSFTLASSKNWDHYLRPSRKLFRRLGKFSFFVALGYAIHLPASSFREFRYVDAAGWNAWLQVDVLQCIGVSLIGLQMLILLARTPRRLAIAAGTLGGLVLVLTPPAWSVDWARFFPSSLASYLNSSTGSLFPLFPWAGYVWFGAALGGSLRQWSVVPSRFVRQLALGGLALFLVGLILSKPALFLYPGMDFWKTSPTIFLMRAGCIGILLSVFAWFVPVTASPSKAWRWLAQESLLIYFVHLAVLYGSVWNPGLRQWIGWTLAPLPTFAWICLLLFSMVLLGGTWGWLKRAAPRVSYAVRFAVLALAVAHLWA